MLFLNILPLLTLLASIVIFASPSMWWKYLRHEKAKAITDDSTTEIDLPDSGHLSAINLHIKNQCSSNNQAQVKQMIEAWISKILVEGDGDQALYELNGEECHAHSFYNDREIQPMTRTLYGNKTQREMYSIQFGRYLGDLEYMVDLEKWTDLKLKITNGFTSTQFTASQGIVDVFLLLAKGNPPSASQYLKTWEYSSDAPSAAGQYVKKKLPKRYDYRRLMFQTAPDLSASTNAMTNDPSADAHTWKFGFKEMDDVLFDCRSKDMYRLNARQFGKVNSSFRFTPSTTLYADMMAAYIESVTYSLIDEGSSADVTVDTFEDGNGRFQKQNFKGGATFAQVMARGLGYLHTFVVDFDFRQNRSDWINGESKSPIESEWYGSTADHSFKIIPTVPMNQGVA